VHLDPKGNIWVFHRCFNVVPPGSATCVGRGPANPPILQFDPSGKLLKSFGAGLFGYPHGFTIDGNGNLWATDVNDQETVLGMSALLRRGVARDPHRGISTSRTISSSAVPALGSTSPTAKIIAFRCSTRRANSSRPGNNSVSRVRFLSVTTTRFMSAPRLRIH